MNSDSDGWYVDRADPQIPVTRCRACGVPWPLCVHAIRPDVVGRLVELASVYLADGTAGEEWTTRAEWSTPQERIAAFGPLTKEGNENIAWYRSVADQQDAMSEPYEGDDTWAARHGIQTGIVE